MILNFNQYQGSDNLRFLSLISQQQFNFDQSIEKFLKSNSNKLNKTN